MKTGELIHTHSVQQTVDAGMAIGRHLGSGTVVALAGDLGTGKTQLAKGIARGLGCTELVHSPTFALLHEYGGGRVPTVHLDLYRLAGPAQIEAAGLAELLDCPAGVLIVEWPERWFGSEMKDRFFRVVGLRRFLALRISGEQDQRTIECLCDVTGN